MTSRFLCCAIGQLDDGWQGWVACTYCYSVGPGATKVQVPNSMSLIDFELPHVTTRRGASLHTQSAIHNANPSASTQPAVIPNQSHRPQTATMMRQDHNRIDPKRRNVVDYRKKQFATPQFKDTQYPHRLNFYADAPTADITLEQFEQWAIDRLRGNGRYSCLMLPAASDAEQFWPSSRPALFATDRQPRRHPT